MPVHDELGTRMKEFYEEIPKTRLMRRTPVAIRIDGKAFHTFTRGFQKPFDGVLVKSMQETMKYLCENIQGCVLGYTQSDEITLILIDYKKLTSSAWFDYEVQKMCSIAASMATMAFNKFFYDNIPADTEYTGKYYTALDKGAMFDARCFNIPKEEVANLIYWRQLDAMRNSIQMVGQANFSHKELQGKSCENIKEMLAEKGIFYESDFPIYLQRGSACRRTNTEYPKVNETTGEVEKININKWSVDCNMPIIKEDRDYIEKLIYFD